MRTGKDATALTDALINMQHNCLKALDDRECTRYVRLFTVNFANMTT